MVNNKDIKVELLRIIACFMVLVYHTRRLPILDDGSVSETAIFIECMCTICVVTFFLISGFFIYKKDNNIFLDWWHISLSYLKTLCRAGLLMVIFSLLVHDFIVSKSTLIACVKEADIKSLSILLIDGIKSFSVNRWPGTSAHLWYVFSYGLIILCYPITRLFLKLDKRVVYVVLILLAVLQLYDDILVYYDKWTLNRFFDYVPRPVIYSAWGHLLYNDILAKIRKKDIEKFVIDKKVMIISIVMYVISFVGIFYMQYMYNTYVNGIHTYTAWYSIGSLTMSMALVMCVMDINIDKIFNDNIKKMIYTLGGMTLGIYMLHYPIVVKLNTMLFQKMIQDTLGLNFVTQMIYVVFYNLLIFVLSILLLFVVRFVGNRCKWISAKIFS
ncbi:MAG: acyltransferase [Lachnospiraceae bacterium]|nr:acyltransferase [Lachnospiraceae bacterium]